MVKKLAASFRTNRNQQNICVQTLAPWREGNLFTGQARCNFFLNFLYISDVTRVSVYAENILRESSSFLWDSRDYFNENTIS
jgi:hypothetical protein